MEDYAKLYHLLFNAITDALEQMNAQNFGSAKETLVSAQQKAEEIFITATDRKRSSPDRGERSNAAPAGSLPPFSRHTRLTK